MPREGYFYIKSSKLLTDTFKEFVKENKNDTMAEFMEKSVIMYMLAKDKKLFLEILEKKMEEENKEYKVIKNMIELFEIMDFYNRDQDKIITQDGEISVKELLKNGFEIKDKQVIQNK